MVRINLDESAFTDISYIEFSDWLEALNATQFESFVGDVYEGMGYSSEVTQQTKDRGVDVRIHDDDELRLIQVKLKREGKVGAEVVDRLVGAADRQVRAVAGVVLVTNTSFTNAANRNRYDHFVNGHFDIELVNGIDFHSKIANHDLFYLMDEYIPHHRRGERVKRALRRIKSEDSVQ